MGSALLWLGLALILLPLAIICFALMVAIAVEAPVAGIVFGVCLFGLIRGIVSSRRKSA